MTGVQTCALPISASIVGRVLEVFCKRMMNFSLKSQGHKAVRQRLRYAHRNGPGAGLRAEAACVGTPGWLGPRGQWPSRGSCTRVMSQAAFLPRSLFALLGGRFVSGCAVLRTASVSISRSWALVFGGSRLGGCHVLINSMWGCGRERRRYSALQMPSFSNG